MLPTGMQSRIWAQLKVRGLFGDILLKWENSLPMALKELYFGCNKMFDKSQ